MWPFSTYPERSTDDVANKPFDYIIVGGGTAGCLVANRLSSSAPGSVLVLEKGRVDAGLLSRIPLLGPLQSGVVNRVSDPNAHLRDRRVKLVAAELLGGTSRVNSMVWARGCKEEYDSWAKEFGLDEWAWDQVKEACRVVEEHEGGVQKKKADDLGFMPYVEAAMAKVGLDVSGNGAKGTGTQGFSRCEIAVGEDGRRSSALTAWLDEAVAKERQMHLTICTGAVATRLELGDDESRVSGVRVRPVGKATDVLVKACREVIVCSGTIGTPQLLMRSGIGPKAQLADHGIPVVHDLPAVGHNLITHVQVPIMTELPRKHTFHVIETAAVLWHFLLYLLWGAGVLASSGQHGSAAVDEEALDDETLMVQPSRRESSSPDIQVLVCPLSTLLEHGIPDVPCLTWLAGLVRPCSKGMVELTSGTDPEASPKITFPLLTDERDRLLLRKAVRFAMRLADEFASPETAYPYPAPLAMAPGMSLAYLDAVLDKTKDKNEKMKVERGLPPQKGAWRTVTDHDIDEYVERLVTGSYDPSSTCRMSLAPEGGVVDQRLKVHGVSNLRIADASVLPMAGRSSISSTVYVIGQRCAAFVLGESQEL